MMLIMALINVGSLVWINNGLAITPDDDQNITVPLSAFRGVYQGENDLSDDTCAAPISPQEADGLAQGLIYGNGGLDDNREESYTYQRPTTTMRPPKAVKSASTFNNRYTAKSFQDFGHLKVMPAGDAALISDIFINLTLRLPEYCGRPLAMFFRWL